MALTTSECQRLFLHPGTRMIFVILKSASCLNMRNRFISISPSNDEFTCAATQLAYCVSCKQLFDRLLLTSGCFIHIIALRPHWQYSTNNPRLQVLVPKKCHLNALAATAFVRGLFSRFLNSLSHRATLYWRPKFLLPYIKQCHIIAPRVSVKVARPL